MTILSERPLTIPVQRKPPTGRGCPTCEKPGTYMGGNGFVTHHLCSEHGFFSLDYAPEGAGLTPRTTPLRRQSGTSKRMSDLG